MDADDNPYLVFESLNAKGRPLTQADLIRNYFFMRIHVDKQEQVYSAYWQPMQDALQDTLTEFIRHFLMKEGSIIKQTDVYYVLKDNVNPQNSIGYLEDLQKHSVFYQRILHPDYEIDEDLRKYFKRLNEIEVTTAYPLLLKLYNYYASNNLSKEEILTSLQTIENYLIRRFVCGIPTNQLNKIFPALIPQLITKYESNIPEGLKYLLQTKGYPKDNEFKVRLKEAKLYGGGDRYVKTRLILRSLEEHFAHKENVLLENLTIEHVMPQTLSEVWQNHLGEDWEETHELYLHTIGNLTLTAYNTELSNDDFFTKREIFIESHLELNKYFIPLDKWTKEEIDKRSESLTNKALEIWPYFGHDNSSNSEIKEVTGTIPTEVKILGQSFSVKSWRDVLELTLNTVADLEPEKFEIIAHNFPRYLGKDRNKFRAVRELENGYFMEVNLSAQNIQRLCYQAMETIELSTEDWKVAVE